MGSMSREQTTSKTVPETFTAYAETTTEPRFREWCRLRAEPDWSAAVGHRLPTHLCADTLDDAVFQRYLVQDHAFLKPLIGTYGHAVSEAPSMTAKGRITEFLALLTDDEGDYFERSFDALGVSDGDRTAPDLRPPTRAFEDLLGRAARDGGYAETLAVLVPIEWMVHTWADRADNRPTRFYLAEWIDLHTNATFAGFVSWLRAELDREGTVVAPARQRRLERLFRRTVELQVAFFESAYESGPDMADTLAGGTNAW